MYREWKIQQIMFKLFCPIFQAGLPYLIYTYFWFSEKADLLLFQNQGSKKPFLEAFFNIEKQKNSKGVNKNESTKQLPRVPSRNTWILRESNHPSKPAPKCSLSAERSSKSSSYKRLAAASAPVFSIYSGQQRNGQSAERTGGLRK
jgi:hypothetical protein